MFLRKAQSYSPKPDQRSNIPSVQLQLAYLWMDYHQTLAGPPALPPLSNFYLRTPQEHRKLRTFLAHYQNHLRHVAASLRHLRIYFQLYLQLYQRSGSATHTFSVWKLQTRLWRLSIRYSQGRFRLAFLNQAISNFTNRAQQRETNQKTQAQLRETQKQIRSLQSQIQQMQAQVRKRETLSEFGQQKLQHMDQMQRRLKQQLKRLQKQLHNPRSSKPKIQKMYDELQQDTQQQRVLTSLTASDTPVQLAEWQQCDVQGLLVQKRRSTLSQGLLWGGLATLGVGLFGVGIGSYLVATSYNPSGFRPAEAAYQRDLGTGALVGGASVTVLGGALMLSQVWIRPSSKDQSRATLKCPPKKLFPTAPTLAQSTSKPASQYRWMFTPPLSKPSQPHMGKILWQEK
ncbi:MAG: hypothetical protein EP343_11280 [Deltaproteobacteria bacterium]|nr:MAG: hypothetical protein EP343_11280 [Deltaproteobacteria bacterium]